ncbi:tryptophan halogenase family protein [Neptunicella marina]|uniref:Tryptophan 7-halogenase n=1 Tax=Neptunicella marina TaxID=2125989 RepID=A0A8J6IU76_9ALTE|nr:tryptophan halogenase family protein [Neptunicella marina]MBC3765708.1 tryptophan 7-halogenase [Neptunicella marina]
MAHIKHPVKTIVIAGGGTAGWMTAATLAHHFSKDQKVKITLVESSQIGTIGVGEATIPTLRRFYARLGLSDIDVIKATQATCKLGIEFQDWHQPGSHFVHPFGLFGQPGNNIPFHHYWLKQRQTGDTTPLSEYSLGVMLAEHDKFCMPSPKPAEPWMIFDWALHFDAGLFAELMQKTAQQHGVEWIDAKIEQVCLNQQSGNIDSLQLDNQQPLTADLFIDCSGFRSLLLGDALKVGYQSWQQWLLCDKAVAVQSELTEEPIPRTIAKAQTAGWQWRIPLQQRCGNGHVYSSQYTDTDIATETLLKHIPEKTLHQPRHFSFTPGRRDQAWVKNCVAIGLSSGFLEPLESTSIALIETAIEKLLLTFDQPQNAFFDDSKVERFNQVTATEYERVRDFIILHYKLNQREGEMWRYCREMDIPDSLSGKMQQFKSQGDIPRLPWEIFGADSWLAIYNGMQFWPQKYNAGVDKLDTGFLHKTLGEMHQKIQRAVSSVPPHSAFLQRFCDYQPKQEH